MRKRETFHLSWDLFDSLDVGETLEIEFTEDRKAEYKNCRNQIYRFNMHKKPKHFSMSVKTKKGFVIFKREN